MRPISEKYLVNTVTVYNKFIEEALGKPQYYRTVIKHCRIMRSSSTLVVSTELGQTRSVTTEILIDRRNSLAQDEAGKTKTYLRPHEWAGHPEREKYWTLQDGDYVLEGGQGPVLPVTEADLASLEHSKLQGVMAVNDLDGSVHHWKCQLV